MLNFIAIDVQLYKIFKIMGVSFWGDIYNHWKEFLIPSFQRTEYNL